MATWWAFVATAWLVAMVPGVVHALLLRQTLVHGRPTAFATIAGTSTGILLWSVATAGGLSALLLANETAYAAMRWAGGLFLTFVGLKGIMRSPRDLDLPGGTSDVDAWKGQAFTTGLLTNLGNPQAGVFALSLLPQFAPEHGNVFLATTGLGVVWALVAAAWYVLFISLVDEGRRWVTGPTGERAVNWVAGVILMALGIAVVFGV